MRFYTILIAVSVVAPLVVANVDAGYKAINDYLDKNVNDDSVESNMKAAVEWLKQLESSKPGLFSNSPVKDLKKFTALQQVIDDTNCDQSAIQMIRENQPEMGSKKERRVDKVLYQIFLNHAKKCSEVYATEFDTRLQQFGEEYKYIKNIGGEIMDKDRREAEDKMEQWEFKGYNHYDVDNIISRYVTGKFSIFGHDYSESLYKALSDNAAGNADAKFLKKQADPAKPGKFFVAKDKVRQLIRELLVKPCNDYVNTFDDLFNLVKFNLKYYQNQRADRAKFHYGVAYSSICRSLLDNVSAVVVNGVTKYIERN